MNNHVFMNNIEAMRFHIGISGSQLYEASIDLIEALPSAEVIKNNKKFTDLLLRKKYSTKTYCLEFTSGSKDGCWSVSSGCEISSNEIRTIH